TKQFYDHIASEDKEFVLYENFYHEILNDPEKYKVIEKIDTWISDRLEIM
ncbi:MAG: hypothetical protein K0Q99_2152, partial [Clostridia bacterium]|nr:hypothetical protein [Clostridia bacterium]